MSRLSLGDRHVGATVRKGAIAVAAATAGQGAIGLLAQILLATWLSPDDFGVFAIALAVSFAFSSISGVGLQTALAGLSLKDARSAVPGSLRLAISFACLGAIVTLLVAPVAAARMSEPGLVPVLAVIALSMPIRTLSIVGGPVLRLELRFVGVAVAGLAAAFGQYLISVVLASRGAGAMSLAAGLLTNATIFSVIVARMASGWLWKRPGGAWSAGRVWRMVRWPLAGDLSIQASIKIDYLIVGLVAPTAVVGGYYFAFQLVAAATALLYAATTGVLFPALSRIRSEANRQVRGVNTASFSLAIAGGAGAAAVISTIGPVEDIFWRGKWDDAVLAVALLASAIPGQVALVAPEQLLKARGGYRRWTMLHLGRMLGVASTVGAIGAVKGEAVSVTDVSLGIALFVSTVSLIEPILLARWTGFSSIGYFARVVPAWVIFVASGWALRALLGSTGVTGSAKAVVIAVVVSGTGGVGLYLAKRLGWCGLSAGSDRAGSHSSGRGRM